MKIESTGFTKKGKHQPNIFQSPVFYSIDETQKKKNLTLKTKSEKRNDRRCDGTNVTKINITAETRPKRKKTGH